MDVRVIPATDNSLKADILHECHDIPTSGHLGSAKTLELVKRQFYWNAMDKEVKEYVTTCLQCQRDKPSNQPPIGLLQPLPIPERPWSSISMDLITQLPRTTNWIRCHICCRMSIHQDGSLYSMYHCCHPHHS